MIVRTPLKDGTQKVTVYDSSNEVYREGVFDTLEEANKTGELWNRYALFGEPEISLDDILDALGDELAAMGEEQ